MNTSYRNNSALLKLNEAHKAAHEALNKAEHAWFEYASMLDIGKEKDHAFEIFENVRHARRLGYSPISKEQR